MASIPIASLPFALLTIALALSMPIHFLLLTGYGSLSKFAVVGAIRACAQCVAHEVGLIVVLLAIFSLDGSLLATRGSIKGASLATGSLMWSALLLAEASRAPFDCRMFVRSAMALTFAASFTGYTLP